MTVYVLSMRCRQCSCLHTSVIGVFSTRDKLDQFVRDNMNSDNANVVIDDVDLDPE